MASVKLAQALLRRKELSERISRMRPLHERRDLLNQQVKRVNVAEGIDEVTITNGNVTAAQLDREYNSLCSQLRGIDAAIQQANWTTDVEVGDTMNDPEACCQVNGN